MKLRSASWPLLCVALATLGCAKGDTGPTGPRGPTGSANVVYSDWYSPSTWNADAEFGVAQRTYTMSAPLLTQAVIDQGVVLVYMRFVGLDPEIIQLPFTAVSPAFSFSFRARADSIKVVYYDTAAPATIPFIIPPSNQVRYVLIPGGVMAALTRENGSTYGQELARVKSMSYSEVCRRHGVPE